MKRILFLVNHDIVIYNFRRELVEKLLSLGNEVIISSPYGERIELLKEIGCRYIPVKMNRHGINPCREIKLLIYYIKLIKFIRPDIIFSYTIKPNLYGAIAARYCQVPIVANITGLGSMAAHGLMSRKVLTIAYRHVFKNVKTIFVQNQEILKFFQQYEIATDKLCLLPGSGVNLEQFRMLDYPIDNTINFVFISRIMKAKGIDFYLEMADYITKKYSNARFFICGFCEEKYEDILNKYQANGIIKYLGMISDIRKVLSFTHCTIHPTFYPEGISNVLLESAASGRPIITTDRSGCREVVENAVNGYLVSERNLKELICAVEKFLALTHEERKKMGIAGRKKVEREFSRNIVIEEYLRQI